MCNKGYLLTLELSFTLDPTRGLVETHVCYGSWQLRTIAYSLTKTRNDTRVGYTVPVQIQTTDIES